MGTNKHWDRLGFCLIGLVVGVLLTAAPQPSLAQEWTGSGEPAAEDEATAGEPDTSAAEEAAEDEAADQQESTNGESSEAEETETAGDESSGGDLGAESAAEGDSLAADGTAADDTSRDPATAEAGMPVHDALADFSETPPANSAANSMPAPIPARIRDPVTGADEPFEPGEGYGVAGEEGEVELDDEEELETGDPLEGMNRVFFKFNDFLDKLLLKPAAQLYRFILPDYVEDRVRNVVNNADSPVILANDILQWKWDRAWHTTSRFFINTTLGVGGIWDVASSFGIDRHEEDFGQTLCVWGVNEWVYLYLPFVGPTSPRDLTGKVVDRFFDPLSYYADVVQQIDLSDGVTIRWNVDRAGLAQISLTAADLIDMRARNIETINEIERTSIDFYTAVRSLYRQSRENACNDGKVEFEDLPDLSDEFE